MFTVEGRSLVLISRTSSLGSERGSLTFFDFEDPAETEPEESIEEQSED